ncbi:TPA: S8 family serine peptidase [Candidatus Thalassarchaeaceae archaeon]|nr:S8 family serine peptidase [Euryarchaeota archaeon]HII42526.1 S8 family serine peptidase [Candidatus Thalassarchaeaceae archaeon]|tara:strand:+ start:319 stop:4788 length:4470 start_codon:yes stop_codon:yes gene_type:complete
MSKRTVCLILGVLLLSYIPLNDGTHESSDSFIEKLDESIQRIEISPDPNSISDLGAPRISNSSEILRSESADSTIGVYTHSGLIPSIYLSQDISFSRIDLAIVIIDGDTGLWDARMEIMEISGIEIRSTIPPSGYLVQGNSEQLKNLQSLTSVESVHEVPAGLLIHPALQDAPDDEILVVEIVGWKNSELVRQTSSLDDNLQDVANSWLSDSWSPDTGIIWGEIQTNDISEIIKHPSVSYIAPVPILKLMNNEARNHMGIDTVEDFFITGLNGSGQKIAVGDSGLDDDHGDFNGRISGLDSVTPGDSSTADPSDGHGTHVACTVLGDGMRSGGTYQGIAPEANLYFQAMEDDDSGALYSIGINSMLNEAYNAGARLHTNSWGSPTGGEYTTSSEDADDRVSTWDQYWQYQGMTVLFAAGNERNDGISSPGTAKNVITVGGHVNRYNGAPDDMYYWSSRGPTDDGRIKPDLVGPGDYVRSCKSQEASSASGSWSNNWYLEYSGTSMATPATAGAAVLVREYLMEIASRPAPQAALIKALLILGAEDMGVRDIPNNNEGWGRVNLVNSLIPESDVGIFVDDRSRLSSGQISDYSFDITRGGEELKVVLAWSDYPGSSSSSTQLRNDLDLEITNPNGLLFKGNVFTNGESVANGQKDSKNNVEVVLVDNAAVGTWTVRVRDSSHGGSNFYQPYSLAVRGVNVNDLDPDPTFVSDSFELSVPIPQVDEEVEFSISLINQGAGSIPELSVLAAVNSATISTKTLSLSPGESAELTWQWTPGVEGENTVSFYIDPNDLVDEVSESNNQYNQIVIVSVPGVRVTSQAPMQLIEGTSDSSTTWSLDLTNTALFETNATIEVSEPIRMQDGVEFDWFSSFSNNTFNLMPAESTTVSLSVVHPAPPEPGLYRMLVTGTDVENQIESEFEIYLEVPLLSDANVLIPTSQIRVNPLVSTPLQIQIQNDGNGPQTYDVELISPSGWSLGLDSIGSFAGSSHGSTGSLDKGESRTIDITINPPGAMIPAGTVFSAAVSVHSRVSSDSWSEDITLVVDNIDVVTLTPTSDGTEHDVSADDLLEWEINFNNQGNRDLELTPYILSKPNGWSFTGTQNSFIVSSGSQFDLPISITGNGLAKSGELKLRFVTEDGFVIDWNRTIDVLSGAIPRIEFYQVALPDGTSADTPLGVDSHPVGGIGFDLLWKVTNDGTMTWRPIVSMEVPNDDWEYSCQNNNPTISTGSTITIICNLIIPLSAEAGSEPTVSLILSGEGLTSENIISLYVDSVNEVIWSIVEQNPSPQGYQTTLSLELQNIGNSDISEILKLEAPNGWNELILDSSFVNLRPGETRSVEIAYTPSKGADGIVTVSFLNSDDITGSSLNVEIDVLPAATSDSMGSINLILIILIIIILGGGVGLTIYLRREGLINSLIPENKIENILPEEVQEESSGVPCWICSGDVIIGKAWACLECGARYHMAGQVQGCNITEKSHCLHCDAGIDQLTEV